MVFSVGTRDRQTARSHGSDGQVEEEFFAQRFDRRDVAMAQRHRTAVSERFEIAFDFTVIASSVTVGDMVLRATLRI